MASKSAFSGSITGFLVEAFARVRYSVPCLWVEGNIYTAHRLSREYLVRLKKTIVLWQTKRLVRQRIQRVADIKSLPERIQIARQSIATCRVKRLYYRWSRGALSRAKHFVQMRCAQDSTYDPRRFLLEIHCEADRIAEVELRQPGLLWKKPLMFLLRLFNRIALKQALSALMFEEKSQFWARQNPGTSREGYMSAMECEVAGRALAILGDFAAARNYFLRALGGREVLALFFEDPENPKVLARTGLDFSRKPSRLNGVVTREEYCKLMSDELPALVKLSAFLGILEVAFQEWKLIRSSEEDSKKYKEIVKMYQFLHKIIPFPQDSFFKAQAYYRLRDFVLEMKQMYPIGEGIKLGQLSASQKTLVDTSGVQILRLFWRSEFID